MKRKIIYIFITLALILSAFLIAKMQKPSKYNYLITIYTDTDCYDFTITK